MAGDSILAVGSLPDVWKVGAAALPVTPVYIWTWARVSCSSMTSDQYIRPDVVWSGLGKASCTQLLPTALEETFCLFTSAAPSHGGGFTPAQVWTTVWSRGFNQGSDNANRVVGVLAGGVVMSFLTMLPRWLMCL